MAFAPWELAAIDQAGYNGIRDEEIDRQTFDDACYSLGINPDNFNQDNLNKLQEKLNEF